MSNKTTLKFLLKTIQRLHEAEVERPDGTKVPLVGNWDQEGTVEYGFTVLIPAESVVPGIRAFLQQLGFEYLPDEQFYMFTGDPFEYENGIDAKNDDEGAIPDCMVFRGTVDAEMVDVFMGRKTGYLPHDLIEPCIQYHHLNPTSTPTSLNLCA